MYRVVVLYSGGAAETRQYGVGGLGSDRSLFPRMRGTRIKINELNEESGQNPEI